jgi:DNA replication protein DnaC
MKNKPAGPKDGPDRIRQYLGALRLYRMERALDETLAWAAREKPPVSAVLERLLAVEADGAIQGRMERRLRESRLPDRKTLADFDFDFQPSLSKAQVLELATLSFVERKQGLILAGGSGTGKSHLAKALLLLGCRQLYRCRYTTAAAMLKDLLAGLADGSLPQRLKTYTAPAVLLIDEVGFDRLEQESARNAALFFKVIDGRYCRSSTILTTNIDFRALGDYLGDPVITTAIVDRLVHHSIIINIDGPSWRMHESKQLNRSAPLSGQSG